ncbi:hypothetical protein F9U64_21905 [Gracilibacillus oryzae]|uniref:Saccharopine dehydrogenase NADP binding domain-containing protein n=1 Tax=Gracilibacillus oryzae TaxID=1672701 RepID=A0A7C8L3W2_9BACI|nr:saccharopine dehydrogenase NADP-binding domain-containing protein [Gracilibacillus oryzae]KAB8125690.1 hypothetical protein F9U64_21905 [Gracilibacillus oryzae]
MKKVMVVGASGRLGKLICEQVLRIFDKTAQLVITDYNEMRGKQLQKSFKNKVEFKLLNINDHQTVEKVIDNIDVVIIAIQQKEPHIQKVCINREILCVDVTTSPNLVDQILLLNEQAKAHRVPSIVMAGFLPGLSGLLAKKAITSFDKIEYIHISLIQSSNANVGITGALDMLQLISMPVIYDGETIHGFKEKKTIDILNNKHTVRLIHHPEYNYISPKLAVPDIQYWTSWNDPIFNLKVLFILKANILPLLNKYPSIFSKLIKHDPSQHEEVSLIIEAKGMHINKPVTRTLRLSAFSDYGITAMVTAALAKVLLFNKINGGIYFPFEVTTFEEIMKMIDCEKVRLEELEYDEK